MPRPDDLPIPLRGFLIVPPGPFGGPWRIQADGHQVGTAPTEAEARRIVLEDLDPA